MVRLLRFGPPYCSTSDQIKESLRSILSCARLSIGRLASIVFVFFFQNTFKKKNNLKLSKYSLKETVFAPLPPFFALLFTLLLLLLFLPWLACSIASSGVRLFSLYSGKISVASFFSTFHPLAAVQHPWSSSSSAELQTSRARDTCILDGREEQIDQSAEKHRQRTHTGRHTG